MAEQAGTGGFAKFFLPGLVLGIVIGAATTFAFFTFNEGSTLPKGSFDDSDRSSNRDREAGGADGGAGGETGEGGADSADPNTDPNPDPDDDGSDGAGDPPPPSDGG